MTVPAQIIERALTFKFAKSVTLATGQPDVMDVAVTPLTDASSGVSGATFAGGVKSAQVSLSDPINTVTFNLVPTYSPGLSAPINYRVMWRAGVMARTFTYDFAMPDQDIDFDRLATLNLIIDEHSYLQITDLGVPGRVARLDQNGHVIDSAGNQVASGSDITGLNNQLAAESVARQQGDANTRAALEGELTTQVNATLNTSKSYTDNHISSVSGDIFAERASRQTADTDIQNQINSTTASLQHQIDSVAASTGGNTDALNTKADLDGTGHIPLNQIPSAVFTTTILVPDQPSMLALTTSQVQKGDMAVRPDGVWSFSGTDPSQLSHWTSLTTVSSVNGKRGAVTLTASDVSAIPVGGAVAMSQVTGLSTSLTNKANQTDMTAVQAQVSGILSDTTLVHTVSGVVPTNLMSSDMVYLNSVGQLVKKDGTIIPIAGGGGGSVFSVNGKTGLVVLTASDVGAIPTGGSVTTGQVTGLATALAGKADLVAGTVPLVQLPNLPINQVNGLTAALATKADLVSGLIPLSEIPVFNYTQTTGLAALVSGNQLTSSSAAVNRIASLEAWRATNPGGGGGGGISTQAVFYTSANTSSAVTDFTQVNMASPWGIDSDGTITGTVGTWYYLYTGVRSTDVAYPYITANGHLNLRKWNESGASDPVYALASDLTTLSGTVAGKAAQSDLVALQNVVATKTNQSDFSTLSTRVDGKASQADLNATNSSIAAKANQSDLNNLTTVVGSKANQSDLTALTSTVGTKAAQSALDTTNTNVSALQTALTTKADLSGGKVPLAQVPALPTSQTTGLDAALAAKADLVSGTVPLAQIPGNISMNSIANLGTTLGNKADLVGGKVPMSQLPDSAIPNVVTVANRAALLALTSAQVQYGDFALITGTSDQGTYILTGNNPSQFSSWTPLALPAAPVVSVNGQTGTVVLSASDVGALASNASIPPSQVTGLVAQLASFATTSALTTGLSGKTSPGDVQNMFTNSSMVKRADYVSSAPLASLAGQQSVDGVVVPNGSIVLATAQSSSVNNGLWITASGTWVRPANYATSSYVAKDTLVMVSNATGASGGTNNPYTIWQMTGASAFIDSSGTTWTKYGWIAPPFVPVAGNGVSVSGATISANVQAGKGVLSTSSGLAIDPNIIPSKFVGTVPAGSTVAGITHNLNTTSPIVAIYDTGSNTLVLAGITIVTANSISIEFASAPASGQYRVCVIG